MRSPDVAAERLRDLRVPAAITAIAAAVREAGGRAWLVGGGVRDHLMGRPVKDLDVEVHGLDADALERVLRTIGRVDAVGRSFGVLKVRPRHELRAGIDADIDVSIPRRDSNSGPGHRGIAVEGDPFMPLEEAVRRRDLTINAIMVDVLERSVADPSGGLADLDAGRLRAVDETTFLDDPLRALRVVQFVARTGFTPDDVLLGLCARAALDELPAERIQGEWGKLLLSGTRIAAALEVARSTAVIARVFPELVDDPALDVALQRALTSRAALDGDGRRWVLMLSIWLSAGPDRAEPTLDRLWIHKVGGYACREQILAQLRHRHDPTDTDADLRNLSAHAEVRLALGLRVALHDDPAFADRLSRAEQLGVADHKPAPLLQGRDLHGLVAAGPRMGALLKSAYQAQLDGELTTPEQALAWARQQIGR